MYTFLIWTSWFITAAFGVIALVMFCARWFWVGELMTPYRLQVVAAGIGVLVILLCLHLPTEAVGVGLPLILLALPVLYRLARRRRLPPSQRPAHPGAGCSVVMSNVLCHSHQYNQVLAMVGEQRPDIFIAVETTGEWMRNLMPLQADYAHAFLPEGLGLFGISVFSKEPFQAGLFRIGADQIALGRFEFERAVVYAVHPLPPLSPSMAAQNRTYLDALARHAGSETKPTVLIGDFNSTLWSANLKPFFASNWAWPAGSGYAYSWPSDNPLLAIQIDHVLTRGFSRGSYTLLPNVGSDHFPVRADLSF